MSYPPNEGAQGGNVYGAQPGQPPYNPPPSQPGYGSAQVPQQPSYGAPTPQPSPPQSGQPFGAPAPQSGPPFGGPGQQPGPQSGPPFGGPGQQPPFGGPQSAPPFSAPPAAGSPAAPSGGGGRKLLVVSLVAVLLLLGVGVMSVLYVTKNSELDKTEKQLSSQIAERDTTIGANKTEIEQLQGDLQSMKDKNKELEQNLSGTKSDRDEQARQKRVIGSCLTKLSNALAAAADNDRAAYNRAMKGLDKICDEADKYL